MYMITANDFLLLKVQQIPLAVVNCPKYALPKWQPAEVKNKICLIYVLP